MQNLPKKNRSIYAAIRDTRVNCWWLVLYWALPTANWQIGNSDHCHLPTANAWQQKHLKCGQNYEASQLLPYWSSFIFGLQKSNQCCHSKFLNIHALLGYFGGQFLPFHCRFANSNSKRFAVCQRQIKNTAKYLVYDIYFISGCQEEWFILVFGLKI